MRVGSRHLSGEGGAQGQQQHADHTGSALIKYRLKGIETASATIHNYNSKWEDSFGRKSSIGTL